MPQQDIADRDSSPRETVRLPPSPPDTAACPSRYLAIHFTTYEGESGLRQCGTKLMIVLGGEAEIGQPEGVLSISVGDVYVLRQALSSALRNARELRVCEIDFDDTHYLVGRRGLEQMGGFHALFRDVPHAPAQGLRLRLSTGQLAYATSLLATLKSEFDGDAPGREVIIEGVFLLLVTHLSRLAGRQPEDHLTPALRLANVVSHVQKHFGEPLRVEDLARIAHLSSSQFQRTFKRIYGTTPQKYIRQVRIYKACELLKDPDHDITTVAYETGFASSSFFSTQFKQTMGETPTQYRRKLRELQGGVERQQSPVRVSEQLRSSVDRIAGLLSVFIQWVLTQGPALGQV